MRRVRGISGFVATLILVVISLSLSYAVYEGVSRLAPPREGVFANQALTLGGSPEIMEVEINASSPNTPQAFEADDASSRTGVLYFDGTSYGTTQGLCLPGATTFFSVYTQTSGLLQAVSNGRASIDGYWTGSLVVGPGWHEVMFLGASSCQVTLPDGSAPSFPSTSLTSVPFIGSIPSARFVVYVPTDGLGHSLILVFDGGYDRLA